MKLRRKVQARGDTSLEIFCDSGDARVKTLRALFDENAHSYFCDQEGSGGVAYIVPNDKRLIIFGISFYAFNIPASILAYPILAYFGHTADQTGGLDVPDLGSDPIIFYSSGSGVLDPNASTALVVSPFPKTPFSAISEPYYAEIEGGRYPFVSIDAIGDRDPPEYKMVTEIYGIEVNA